MRAMTGRIPPLLLASASPRRRRLIGWLDVPVDVTSVDTAEDLTASHDPGAVAVAIAAEKASAARPLGPDRLIVACDTIVVLDGAILGKPADLDDARRMLRALSGRTHTVITGVALLEPGAITPRTFSVATPVRMRTLSEPAIEQWVDEGELLGCAGAYNIERHLAEVDIAECFQNVAGLPLCHLYRALVGEDVRGVPEGLRSPVARCDAARGVRCALGPTVAG
ncbi:MAG: Maf family protein [Coriobacteriia bacterium]